MNLEAFQNLKRVLASVPAEELHMSDWNRCAIGHACRDAWFQERGLRADFESAANFFEINASGARLLFTHRAGATPDAVIATINGFIGGTLDQQSEEERRRRQAIIDRMLVEASIPHSVAVAASASA